MDPKQMAVRCPGSIALGKARLSGYELSFVYDSPGWGGGVGTVIPSSGREVWGVLWDLTEWHIKALDRYEGVGIGAYTKEQLDLDLAGEKVNALVYIATDTREKKPSGRYIDTLVSGAKAFSLPNKYVEQLRAFRA
jgi:gamma-glutamylcyclotransferase (GGCT)/AIG2-like uncharacterized protein YtfP